MKVDDNVPYREGVVLDRPVKKGCGSFVNVGMRKEVRIDKSLKPGVRVTVKMGDTSNSGTVHVVEARTSNLEVGALSLITAIVLFP